MCRGRRGAPPVQVVAARPPAAPVVLALSLIHIPPRQLPAHVRLGLQRLAALLQGEDVQRAAHAARESGPVLEDAGALEGTRLPVAVLVLGDPAVPRALGVVLPDVRREPRHMLGHPLLVVLVGEVGTQRAAPVVSAAGLDALAAAAEDAVPARGQPCQIATEDLLVVRRIGKLHPRPSEVETLLVGFNDARGFVALRLFRLWHESRVRVSYPHRGRRTAPLAVAFRT